MALWRSRAAELADYFSPRKDPGRCASSDGRGGLHRRRSAARFIALSAGYSMSSSMQDIFDNSVVSVKCKRPLEHDCSTLSSPAVSWHCSSHPTNRYPAISFVAPFRAGRSCGNTPTLIAGITGGDMIYDLSGSRGLLYPADKVHKHGLPRPTPSNNPEDFPSPIVKEILFRTRFPSKSMQTESTVISGFIPLS